MAKGYKRYTLGQAMKIIEEGGLRGLSTDELRSVGRPIMTETRARLKELRQAGYQKSPAYIAYKHLNLKTSTSSINRNTLLTEVYSAYKFLSAKTSSKIKVDNYLKNTSILFGRELTIDEIHLAWAAIDKLRNDKPELFEQFSYNTIFEEVASQSERGGSSSDVMENVQLILSEKIEQDDDLFALDDSPLWDRRRL